MSIYGNPNQTIINACMLGLAFFTIITHAAVDDLPSGTSNGILAKGLDNLAQGKLDEASTQFRQILKYDPQNAGAHLAQAVIYTAKARAGDRSMRDLAEVGYLQALQFDTGNWVAAYHLGLLYMETGRYQDAMHQLAIAAMNKRDNPDVLNALAAATYFDGRIDTAWRIIEAAQRLAPQNDAIKRNAAMIAAAGGQFAMASNLLEHVSPRLSGQSSRWLQNRVQDWRMVHARLDMADAFTPLNSGSFADAPGNVGKMGNAGTGLDVGLKPATNSPFIQVPDESRTDASGSLRSTLMTPLPRPQDGAKARMVQVDVTLIRTQETDTSTRGVNLLDGLRLQYSRSDTKNRIDVGDSTNSPDFSRVITRAISIPAINYSLNIANDSLDRADVLARPTLVALDGQPANFFSGEEVSIAIAGNFAGGTLTDKTIGMELAVTPTFLDDDTVLLAVNASRGFVNPISAGTFAQSLRTTRQRVTTSVAVDFGQTLILSGLSERQSESFRSGVPLLQEVPGLQYLFSSNNKIDYLKSVIILMTPRPVGQSTPQNAQESLSYGTRVFAELQKQYPEFFHGGSNMEVIARELKQNQYVRSFNREDMDVHSLRTDKTFLHQIVDQIRSVLYF